MVFVASFFIKLSDNKPGWTLASPCYPFLTVFGMLSLQSTASHSRTPTPQIESTNAESNPGETLPEQLRTLAAALCEESGSGIDSIGDWESMVASEIDSAVIAAKVKNSAQEQMQLTSGRLVITLHFLRIVTILDLFLE